MIVVQADLISAITGERDDLCRVEIANDGTGTATRGNYNVRLYGRHGRLIRTARVENYERRALPAWRLIQKAMESLG